MRHICIYLSTHKCFYTRLKLNLSLYFCLCISQRYEKSVEKLQGYINRPLLPIHTAPVFGICHHYDIFIATNNWHHVNYCCVSLWGCALLIHLHTCRCALSHIFSSSSPGGSYSNWWCSLLNADLALSVSSK